MKNMNKTICLLVITLVITGLVITGSASNGIVQTPEQKMNTVKLTKITPSVVGKNFAQAQVITKQVQLLGSSSLLSQESRDALLLDAHHPSVSGDDSKIVGLGYEGILEDTPNVYFTASHNEGDSWAEYAMSWNFLYPPTLPVIDACGDGRLIGTMIPDYEEPVPQGTVPEKGGLVLKVAAADPMNMPDGWGDCAVWNFNDFGEGVPIHFNNYTAVSTAGYTDPDPDINLWAFGGETMVGDYIDDTNASNNTYATPFLSYQANADGLAWIYNYGKNYTESTVTAMDIDLFTLYGYNAWNFNNSGVKDLFVHILNYGVWDSYQGYPIHPDVNYTKISFDDDIDDFEIAACNDYVVIVAEVNGSIVSTYSKDGLTSLAGSATISATGSHPRVIYSGMDFNTSKPWAICTFIKDGSVYYAKSIDGGATWDAAQLVEDPNTVDTEHYAQDICSYGAAWFNSVDTTFTTYYERLHIMPPIPPKAELTVTEIKGGLGVSATVKNVGKATANNVKCTIKVTGGILGHIDVNKEGTQTSLNIGDSFTTTTGYFFGLGSIAIDVTATADMGVSGQLTATGKVFIIFVGKIVLETD